ncbi:MAG: hypothetical protein IIV27_02835, partial [Clostridia bacterium]|nr:hypothetical protein [Clostridia bacterium]
PLGRAKKGKTPFGAFPFFCARWIRTLGLRRKENNPTGLFLGAGVSRSRPANSVRFCEAKTRRILSGARFSVLDLEVFCEAKTRRILSGAPLMI